MNYKGSYLLTVFEGHRSVENLLHSMAGWTVRYFWCGKCTFISQCHRCFIFL